MGKKCKEKKKDDKMDSPTNSTSKNGTEITI